MTESLLKSIRNLLWLILAAILLLIACVGMPGDRSMKELVGVLALVSGIFILIHRAVVLLGGAFLRWVKRMDVERESSLGTDVRP